MKVRSTFVISLIFLSLFLVSIPSAQAAITVTWSLDTTDKGEFITAFAHLYGVPEMEKNDLYFCRVQLDATTATLPFSAIIEVSVGSYAQPARLPIGINDKKVFTYGVNPTFNDKVGQVSTPTPVTVDLKITDKGGSQLYAESKNIVMFPVNYYAWVVGKTDFRRLSCVLATPHADPILKIISTAARATPWNMIGGYQEIRDVSHIDNVDAQMRAVYNVLQNLGITYTSTSPTFSETSAQRVKLPIQTLSDNSGNCIETTLLFDTIFEAIGFGVEFVFIKGHVFIAVQVWPNGPDSNRVLPLETTMLGSASYDDARKVGLQEYTKASSDSAYLSATVSKQRSLGISPTPYMDKMPDAARFYSKLDDVTAKITSAKDAIAKVKDATKNTQSPPSDVQRLYTQANSYFDQGKYPEAQKDAAEALRLASGGGTASTILGLVFLAMPVALIVLVVLYVRARRKKVAPAPVSVQAEPKSTATWTPSVELPAPPPPSIPTQTRTPPRVAQPVIAGESWYCTNCGAGNPSTDKFCVECGRERASSSS